jgi:hypothetical protein
MAKQLRLEVEQRPSGVAGIRWHNLVLGVMVIALSGLIALLLAAQARSEPNREVSALTAGQQADAARLNGQAAAYAAEQAANVPAPLAPLDQSEAARWSALAQADAPQAEFELPAFTRTRLWVSPNQGGRSPAK